MKMFDYNTVIQRALLGAVADILRAVQKNGLVGDQHLYLTFRTDHPSVTLADYIKRQYPEEITIVLQHRFWELEVHQNSFSVTVEFEDQAERLTVPFSALVELFDPSVPFELQFEPTVHQEKADAEESKPAPTDASGKVVTLDAFRRDK